MTTDSDFSKRFQLLAGEKKIVQADLVRMLGKNRATVSKWWNGDIVPGLKNMIAIADLFKCRIEWLRDGTGPVYIDERNEPPNISPGPPILKKIPVISWVQAGEWSEVVDQFQPGYAEEWIDTTATNHPNAFALVVRGDSMEPEFTDGDVITVDPGREAISGSYIIAKNGDEATFKQLVIDGSSVFLKPLNPRYPIKDMTGVEFRIIGVVVFKGKGY